MTQVLLQEERILMSSQGGKGKQETPDLETKTPFDICKKPLSISIKKTPDQTVSPAARRKDEQTRMAVSLGYKQHSQRLGAREGIPSATESARQALT